MCQRLKVFRWSHGSEKAEPLDENETKIWDAFGMPNLQTKKNNPCLVEKIK